MTTTVQPGDRVSVEINTGIWYPGHVRFVSERRAGVTTEAGNFYVRTLNHVRPRMSEAGVAMALAEVQAASLDAILGAR